MRREVDDERSKRRDGRSVDTVPALPHDGRRPREDGMKKARVRHSKVKTNEQSTLGGLIGLVRRQNDWTLREMSEKVGIPLSTLAKVEADKLSLTYDKLQQFTSRLGLTMTEFLAQGEAPVAGSVVTARRSLATGGNSVRISTPNYDYEYLCADLREKRMVRSSPASMREASPSLENRFDTSARNSYLSWKGALKCTCSFTRP